MNWIAWLVLQSDPTAAIVVNDADYRELQAPIDRYIADVTKRWPIKFKVLADREWKKPKEIREALRGIANLEGAILVGRLPLMTYRAKEHLKSYPDKDGNVGVCSLYYEDLDGTYKDEGPLEDGDCKQGPNRGAEIWVSFVYGSPEQARKFFDKTHRYYSGERKYNGRVLLWQTLDIEPANADIKELDGIFKRSEIDHYGKDETTIEQGKMALVRSDLTKVEVFTKENCPTPAWKYHKKDNPLVDQLLRLSSEYYDLYEVHYGGGYFHAYLLTDQVKKLKASPKIACLNACRTGQFDYDPAKSIALAYLFETDGTLAVMGPTVEASWSQLYNLVYRFMAKGDYLGRAWLRKDRLSELDERDVAPGHAAGKTTYHDHTLPSRGSALLGDPFVRLRD